MIHSVSISALPRRPVAAIAAATAGLLLLVAPRYGWHRDELYFREAGHHLAWGYVDQPPFTPFVARTAELVAPGNLVVLRLLPAMATAVTITTGALVVRELGGDRRRMVLGAGAVASAGFVLGVGHLLSTAVFDLTAWMVLLWITARLLRTADPRLWLAYGGVAGLAMENKNLVVLLTASLAAGIVVARRWDVLRSPWLVAGAAVAGLLAAPNLLWQAGHGWPQQDMARALEARIGAENRATLLPLQLLFVGPLLVPALVRGARALHGRPAFRPLLWAWPAGIVAALVTGGRPYYVLPLTTVVALAGVASAADRQVRRLPWLVGADALVAIPLALPVLPVAHVDVAASVNEVAAEQVGWVELVDQIEDVIATLPAREQASAIVLAGSYGEAGAYDLYGDRPAYSPHNSYADFREPTDDGATVVAVRLSVDELAPLFDSCRQVATVDNGLGVDNEVQGQPIVVCRGLHGRWHDVWAALRFLS